MEMFGILLSVPAAFVASAAYSFILWGLLRNWPSGKSVATWASSFVLGGLILEWVLLLVVGSVQLRRTIGPSFYPIHFGLFLLSVPSVATILVAKSDRWSIASCFLTGVLCSILALPVVLTQYAVSEALYGQDGKSGPYGSR